MSNAMLHAKIFALGIISAGMLAAFFWAYVRVYESLSGHEFTAADVVLTLFWLVVGFGVTLTISSLIYGAGIFVLTWWEKPGRH